MNNDPHNKRQSLNIKKSTVQGQIGQALRDLWQLQFLFLGKDSSKQEEFQNRKVLIDKVRNFWIQGVLEKSLYNQALIELNLEKHLDAVEQPFKLDWVTPERIRQSIPTGTRIIDLFNQMGHSATLLILGEPGSGKTITLLEFGRDLLMCAEKDVNHPIPVVFNLSSWGIKKQPITEWLVHELKEKYQVPPALSKVYIQEEKLLLLLDGLDEVKSDFRDECVVALNQFNQEYGRTAKVVCSRIKDYNLLSKKLKLQGAVFIKALSDEQVNHYLLAWGDELSSIRNLAQKDAVFQELLKTPLMLNVTALAYSGSSIQEFHSNKSTQEYISEIFNVYINRMFFRRRIRKDIYKENQAKSWLIFLAAKMKSSSQSIFLIENLQPNIWLNLCENWLYGFLLSFVLTPIIFSMMGIIIIAGIVWSKIEGGIYILTDPNFFYNILFGFLSVLMLGCICSLPLAFIYATLQVTNVDDLEIQIINELKWSWRKIKPALFLYLSGFFVWPYTYLMVYLFELFQPGNAISTGSLISYILLGIIIYPYPLMIPLIWFFPKADQNFIYQNKMINSRGKEGNGKEDNFLGLILMTWLGAIFFNIVFNLFLSIYMVIIGLIAILMSGRVAVEIDSSKTPNQGLWNSIKNSIIFASACTVSFGLSFILFASIFMGFSISVIFIGIVCGLIAGILLGGYGGGGAIIQHLSLRFILLLTRKNPWNYSRFLDYATERIFMQKVGGGYMFVHRLLLEHFAEMK